jgi:hypothetical protein
MTVKSEIERAFLDFDAAMDPVLDHGLDQDTVAAISMGLALRLVQLLLGEKEGVDSIEVAASLCRELIALRQFSG